MSQPICCQRSDTALAQTLYAGSGRNGSRTGSLTWVGMQTMGQICSLDSIGVFPSIYVKMKQYSRTRQLREKVPPSRKVSRFCLLDRIRNKRRGGCSNHGEMSALLKSLPALIFVLFPTVFVFPTVFAQTYEGRKITGIRIVPPDILDPADRAATQISKSWRYPSSRRRSRTD